MYDYRRFVYILLCYFIRNDRPLFYYDSHTLKKIYNNILLYHSNGHHTLKRPWCDIRSTWTTWRVKDSISGAHYRLVNNCDGRASLRAVMCNVPLWPCDDDGGRERRLHVNTPSRRSTPSSREGSTRDGYLHGGLRPKTRPTILGKTYLLFEYLLFFLCFFFFEYLLKHSSNFQLWAACHSIVYTEVNKITERPTKTQ